VDCVLLLIVLMFPTIEIFVSNVRTLHYMHVNIFDRPIIEIATY